MPTVRLSCWKYAGVVELADTQRSGRCARKGVRVQIPPPAPAYFQQDKRVATHEIEKSDLLSKYVTFASRGAHY